MGLNYDWVTFQKIFTSREKSLPSQSEQIGPIFFVVSADRVVTCFAEREDLSEWTGKKVEEVSAHFQHRDAVFFDYEEMDRWVAEASRMPRYYDQVEYIKSKAAEYLGEGRKSLTRLVRKGSGLSELIKKKHFLLAATQSWWSRLLPANYGIYVCTEGGKSRRQDILIINRRGTFESFVEPDFKDLPQDTPEARVKFLAEEYAVSVQGVYVAQQDWDEWSKSEDPWSDIAQAIREKRLRLAPFRWGLVSLIATRAYLHF